MAIRQAFSSSIRSTNATNFTLPSLIQWAKRSGLSKPSDPLNRTPIKHSSGCGCVPSTSVHYGQGAIFVGFLVRLGHVAIATAFLLPLISSAPASADATVRIGGSTNDTPALTKIAVAYQAANPGTTVSIKGSSSGEGIAALKGHSLDIACSDVAVDDPDLHDSKIGVVGFVFVVGSGAGVTNLTRDQVAGIYSGKFTNWKQIGGNDLAIVPFSRPIGVGTRFVFETTVAKTLVPMEIKPDATAVVNAVATTPGSIGKPGKCPAK